MKYRHILFTIQTWLGYTSFSGKVDVWSAHELEVFQADYCSDGFCLNLCHVLLQLCQPFSLPSNPLLYKIKATYSHVTPSSEDEREKMSVHARGDTFVELCFFLKCNAQQLALSLGFHVTKCFNQDRFKSFSIITKYESSKLSKDCRSIMLATFFLTS